MVTWLDKWKNLQKNLFDGARRSQLLSPRVIWLGVVGILLLIFGSIFDGTGSQSSLLKQSEPDKSSVQQQTVTPPATVSNTGTERAVEDKLAQVLSKVKGAGNVTVSVTFEGGARQEHAKNKTKETKVVEEKDTAGGVRTTTESKQSEQFLISKENGADKPVTVMETRPIVKGVLVVADGAADSSVKADLIRAVETGLGIASYKITVLPQRK